jgi:hypothetical protein
VLVANNLYRYIDEQGNVVIEDVISSEMIRLGYEVIGDSGLVVEVVPPGKTLAEEAEAREQKLEEKKKEFERKEQLRKDAALLRQFSSVSDIIRNRDAELLGLEQRIKVQEIKSNLLQIQLEDQQKRAATHERLGQALPSLLKKDIDLTRAQIDHNKKSCELLEGEKSIVAERYQRNIIRYKELESMRLSLKKQEENNASEPVSYDCPDKQSCDLAWQLAQVYAKDHASGKIEIINNTLVLTSKPEKDTDIALSFSKIPMGNQNYQIMLEVTCNSTKAGAELCESEPVREIRYNYLRLVKKRVGK